MIVGAKLHFLVPVPPCPSHGPHIASKTICAAAVRLPARLRSPVWATIICGECLNDHRGDWKMLKTAMY
ncbi:hypothetical protein AMC87_CH01588 [Rhizobium phaseoli]|nr:hypothetical protein AMC87_CH01588 [Rhizobium phaseoli]EGE55648.1 hypothetical protein RHECNPAF_890060 [Rhizobium etli CNPAF512]